MPLAQSRRQQHQGVSSRAAAKRNDDTQRRLALAQSMWDSIDAEQRQQLLTVPLQELQQRAADLPNLMPHSCPGAASCGWLDIPAQLQQAVERLQANGSTERWRFEQQEFATFDDFQQAIWHSSQLHAQLEALFTQERAKVACCSSSSSSSAQSGEYSGTARAVLSSRGPGSSSSCSSLAMHHQGSAADVGGGSAMPNSSDAADAGDADVDAVCDRLAALYDDCQMQLQGRSMNPTLGRQEQTACMQRMRSLFDSVDERVCVLASRRSEHRAKHGPGSSWVAGSSRGYNSGERAELLEVVKYVQEQLLTEHLWLRQALLEPVGEYVWQRLPENVRTSGSKQFALQWLELLPVDALLDIATYLRHQLGGPSSIDAAAAAAEEEAAGGPASMCSPPGSSCDGDADDDEEPDQLGNLLCLTADGSCMTLSQVVLQMLAGPQDGRPGQLLEWVYTQSATHSSCLYDCASELHDMRTPERVMQSVLSCIRGQQDLSQHMESLQDLEQALQQVLQQWTAVEAQLKAPGFAVEAASLELMWDLLQRQLVLDRALLVQSRQQLSDVQGEAAPLELQLETAGKMARLQGFTDPKQSPNTSTQELQQARRWREQHRNQAAILQQRVQQNKMAEANFLKVVEETTKARAEGTHLLRCVQSMMQQGQRQPQQHSPHVGKGRADVAVQDTSSSSSSSSSSVVQQPVTGAHSQLQAPENAKVIRFNKQATMESLRQRFNQDTIEYLKRYGRDEVEGWLSWLGAYLLQMQRQYEGGQTALRTLWQLLYTQGADDHSAIITAVLLLPLIQQRLDAAAAAYEAERFSKLLASWQDDGGTADATSKQDQQSKKRRNKSKQKHASLQPASSGSAAADSQQARSSQALDTSSVATPAAASADMPHSAAVSENTAGMINRGSHLATQPATAAAADGSSSNSERQGGCWEEEKDDQAVWQAQCSFEGGRTACTPAVASFSSSSSSSSTAVEQSQQAWYSMPGSSSSSSGAGNRPADTDRAPAGLAGSQSTAVAADPASAATAAAAPIPGHLPLYGQPYRPLHSNSARPAAWQGSSSSTNLRMLSAAQPCPAQQQRQHPVVQAPCTEPQTAENTDAAAPAAATAGNQLSEDDGLLCVICQDAPRTHALLHGGSAHQCLCGACSVLYEGGSKDCPICRQQVQAVVRLYNV